MSTSYGPGFFRRAGASDAEGMSRPEGSSAPAANEPERGRAGGHLPANREAALHQDLERLQKERERRRECWSLLAALQMLRAHLWIGRVGEPTQGLSVILAADTDNQTWFLIDALRESGDFVPGTALYFDTQVEGRRLRFECELAEVVAFDGGPAYRAIQPQVVLDQQRRNAYRVRVPASLRVPATLSSSSFRSPGRVLDLSTRGCSTRVESPLSVDRGDPLRVQFKLGELDVSCSATVRHVEACPGAARIGMEFDVVTAAAPAPARGATQPSADVPSLEQAVARLQREILRRRQEQQHQQ
jgi:hypothetical protein